MRTRQVYVSSSGETDFNQPAWGARRIFFGCLSRQQRAPYNIVPTPGPGREYNFLFFNLNSRGKKLPPDLARNMKMVSAKSNSPASPSPRRLDREAIVRWSTRVAGAPLFLGDQSRRESSLGGMPPIPHPQRSWTKRRAAAKEAGFTLDHRPNGEPAAPWISNANSVRVLQSWTKFHDADRTKMAT